MSNFLGCHTGFGGMGFMGGGMFFYGIITLLVILAAFYFINRNHTNRHQPKALEILDQEYAKGNVSDEDYKKRKENLNN